MNKNTPNTTIKSGIYISWFILVSFYLYQYILRSSSGVLIDEIRYEFKMNADDFAFFGSMYYYGYSLMQIPLGIIIDRIGIRHTAIYSISLCIIGTILFTTTQNIMVAYFSRLLMGIGSASAFMGSIKLASDYFPRSMQGVIMGATLTFGAIGALITGFPLNYLLESFSTWQTAFMIFGALGSLILLLAFIYLPKNKKKKETKSEPAINIWENLKTILKNKHILLYACIAIGLFTPLSVMADLWGTAFLVNKFNITRESASPILMNIYIGMAVGSIVIPLFLRKYSINRLIQFSTLMLFLLFVALVYLDNLTHTNLIALLIVIGFFCGAEMLCFTAALGYTNSKISGLTIGIVNTLNMLAGAIMQQAIGSYLDFTWTGQLDQHGLRIYSPQEFVEAFSILVAIIGICAIIAFTTLGKNKVKTT